MTIATVIPDDLTTVVRGRGEGLASTPLALTVTAERGVRYSLVESDDALAPHGPLADRVRVAGGTVLVVVDEGVWRTRARAVTRWLGELTGAFDILVLPGGEANKTLGQALRVVAAMDRCQTLRRSTPVVAIGGGVVCDLVGFAASVYRRGVPYVRVPTTLLAQVDVSVAIKTGVNHGGFRNRLGAFWAPELTVIDRGFLATQSRRQVSYGLGETRRCFEQVLIDVGLHRLPVILLGTGPGVAYHFFGPTHCAVDDFALLRTVPGLTLLSPASMAEASALLAEAIHRRLFAYLRVPRFDAPPTDVPALIGQPVEIRDGRDATIFSTGALTPNAVTAADALSGKDLSVAVVHVNAVRPLDPSIVERARAASIVVTVEEHLRDGGLGTELLHALSDGHSAGRPMPRVVRMGLETAFVSGYGTWSDAIDAAGLDAPAIARAVAQHLGAERR